MIEIERKFLVTSDAWRSAARKRTRLAQGYILTGPAAAGPASTVRIRIAGDKAFLTIKSATKAVTRLEFEYAIPVADAEAMLKQVCAQPLVEKTRHEVEHDGHVWEVDEFAGLNAGLIVAELELKSEDETFAHPPWLGAEVSHDARYFNSNLAHTPFTRW